MSDICWTCFLGECRCDKALNERFEKRQIGRNEYRALNRQDRQGELYKPSLLRTHFWDIDRELKRDQLPEYLQYRAVSDAYLEHIEMSIADWGGSEYEKELEQAVSRYHAGMY